ncbi:MAG: fimbrillin family protein [Rikenellaceae bacterium]
MKKILTTTLMITALVSCQKSDIPQSSAEVAFTSGIETRVSGTEWDAGDKIGVFMYGNASTTVYDKNSSNALYTNTVEGESANFTSGNPLLFPQDSEVDFIAYYPYTEDIKTYFEGSYVSLGATDQTTNEALNSQDFMTASITGCSEGDTPVLSFTRQMSRIVITVDRKENNADAALSDIVLSSLIVDANFTLVNGVKQPLTLGETVDDIALFENESNIIEAIVLPQTASSAKLSLYADGEYLSASISTTFEAGKQYNYLVSIGGDKITFSTGEITDWDEDIIDNGDLYLDDVVYSSVDDLN